MKRCAFGWIMILSLLALVCRLEAISAEDEVVKLVKKASDYLIEKKVADDCKKGFFYLIKAVELSAEKTGLPEDYKSHIKNAYKIFEKTSIFNQEGVSLLHDAYVLVHDGRKFQMPDDFATIQDAVDYARKVASDAVKKYKEGDAAKASVMLLDVAIMTVTPIERK